MCWLAQGEVFDFALGEFRSIPTRFESQYQSENYYQTELFRSMLYRFDAGNQWNDGFDFIGIVIELATELGMSQETAVTKFLQGALADAKLLADLMTCKPFVQTLAVSLMLQQLHFLYQASYLAIIKSNAFFSIVTTSIFSVLLVQQIRVQS